jgi:hypothetical protein
MLLAMKVSDNSAVATIQFRPAALPVKRPEHFFKRLLVILAEIRDDFEIGPEFVDKPRQLHISPAFPLEPAGGTEVVEISALYPRYTKPFRRKKRLG